MKMIMRVTLAALPAPDFQPQWQALLQRIGALSANAREQGRLHFVLLDIEPERITPIAEAVFHLTNAKPDFLPQMVQQPQYGVKNY